MDGGNLEASSYKTIRIFKYARGMSGKHTSPMAFVRFNPDSEKLLIRSYSIRSNGKLGLAFRLANILIKCKFEIIG